MFRDLPFTFIKEYILAKSRTLASIRPVARHLETLVAWQDIGARIQESGPTSAKIRHVRRRLLGGRRSRSTCERTIRHGSQIPRCRYLHLT